MSIRYNFFRNEFTILHLFLRLAIKLRPLSFLHTVEVGVKDSLAQIERDYVIKGVV